MTTKTSKISLHGHALFAGLDPHDVTALAHSARLRSFPADATIFYQDDTGDGLYIIQTGRVKIALYAEDGRETMIAIMSPGDCFGELAVLDGEPRSATAVTLEPVTAWYIRRVDFLACIRRTPELAFKIIALLTRRLRQTDEQLGDLVFFDVFSRVAKRVLELAESHGVSVDGGTAISLPMTQQELANLVGASRESVNKALRMYRQQGYVSVGKQGIVVHDPQGLRKYIGTS